MPVPCSLNDLSGICWAQALFLEDKSSKLATQVKGRKAYLKAVAVDPASAMAELIALEYFVGVTASAKVKEVQH